MWEFKSTELIPRNDKGARRPRVGFWRLLWARLRGRCGFCGGGGFCFAMTVRAYPTSPWTTATHPVQCPGCGQGSRSPHALTDGAEDDAE